MKDRQTSWRLILAALMCCCVASRTQAQDFILGVDPSHLQRTEDGGGVFYDDSGSEADALAILSDHLVNWTRLRLWHTPPAGYNDLERTLELASRVKAAGMKLLLDIHYSDSWADPGQQTKPDAWTGLDFATLVDSVRDYTERVVAALKTQGTLPDMVQIGNEITSGMLWPDGRVGGSYDTPQQWQKLADLLNAGIEGVNAAAAGEPVETMIHIDRGGDNSGARWFYDNLAELNVEFDVIGLSFYPWWHGSLPALEANLSSLASRYDKEIVVVEIAYPWTLGWGDDTHNIIGQQNQLHSGYPASVEGQRDYIRDLAAIVRSTPNDLGRGFFYWEPAHIPAPGFGSPWENVAVFDFDGQVLASADAFLDASSAGQPLEITFRYVPTPSDDFVRAFLPGDFNNWGNNDAGRIPTGDPSQMTYVDSLDQWMYTFPLEIGATYEYKIHFHFNDSGSEWSWISDPLNPITNPADNNNSVITITDPMVFQPAREINADGLIDAVSAGVFGTAGFETIDFEVNGVPLDGLPYYDPSSGIFRYVLDRPIRNGSQFKVTATDSLGREVSIEIGEVQPPVTWVTPDYETFVDDARVIGSITRQDGTVDPAVTEATLIVNGSQSAVSVTDGHVETTTTLQRGANHLVLEADVDGSTFRSDTLTITQRQHPLADSLVTATVTGSGLDFGIEVEAASGYIPPELGYPIWTFDSTMSTVGLDGHLMERLDGFAVQGTAERPGELYFDIDVTADDGNEDHLRVAVIIEEDGTVRPMRYEETASWINRAVVYEIFPLSFGPTEASGSPAAPGTRFDEITQELDYIAQMGFTTLWFMPIFHNQFMDPLSGGYNIIDFYNVDPKLGTNQDFKDLVERAHELGLRVILDITPNHVSPVHPWVESLRELRKDSPFFEHIQTEPSAHDRGLDNRGPNLSEIWQTEGGTNLYRKYDGFGDLANLNWDDDDLQAHLLDVFAYWIEEFDVDGYRMDVYWGPWRRYGPERFGRPIRELIKRIKPDAWLLGEIAGTGISTEVYYADDDFGTGVVGGIDAGYDWRFYFDAIRGTYGSISTYDTYAHNNDFWPGPNARYFRFLENHDEPRIAKLYANSPERILPLTGFLLTTTGIPMVYQGQEVNFGNIQGDERRLPVSWQTDLNGTFAEEYQRLAHARTSFPAFWTQDLATVSTANNVYVYVRPYLDENALVLVNFAGAARTVTINPTSHVEMTTDGPIPYTHLFADSTHIDAELDGFTTTLSAYETAVFITKDEVDFTVPELPGLPFGAVYTGAEDAPGELPDRTALHANYPNPFNPETIIPYSLAEPGRIRLEIFDVLGRRVALLVDQEQPSGHHTATFRADALSSGTYYYRLDVNGRVITKAMLLAK